MSILERDVRRNEARCRFVGPTGMLGPARSCFAPHLQLLAHGTTRWSLRLRLRLPRGRYTIIVRAVDTHGSAEAGGRGADVVALRVT